MKDKYTHIHENAYYEIGNYSVSSSFLFASEADIKKFKAKIDIYFEGLCDVICYGFDHEEYRMIIKMKTREDIEAYCKKRYPMVIKKKGFIPHTAYIFARVMADLQSGYVKWFNFKYSRIGGLMAGRYYRHLIESEEELQQKIKEINGMTIMFQKTIAWRYKSKLGFRFRSLGKRSSSSEEYKLKNERLSDLRVFRLLDNLSVRGHFKNLPPKRISWKNDTEKYRNLIGFILLGGN